MTKSKTTEVCPSEELLDLSDETFEKLKQAIQEMYRAKEAYQVAIDKVKSYERMRYGI